MQYPNVSIIIPAFNSGPALHDVIQGMQNLQYPGRYEVIIVNDGSKDGTRKLLNAVRDKRFKVIHFSKNKGVCKARNAGIKKAKYDIIINMDHDCIPAKHWLKDMVKPFMQDAKVGFVSSYDLYGGTSSGFTRKALKQLGKGYDEDFYYFREDSDLAFRIEEAGFKLVENRAQFHHTHEDVAPQGVMQKLQYAWKRLNYHQNDVLLYKKHPGNKKVKKFLQVIGGFLIDPIWEFKTVTGLWHKGGKFGLKSPRGITFLENKSMIHALIIVFIAVAYVFVLKMIRLYASIKFRKLLV